MNGSRAIICDMTPKEVYGIRIVWLFDLVDIVITTAPSTYYYRGLRKVNYRECILSISFAILKFLSYLYPNSSSPCP